MNREVAVKVLAAGMLEHLGRDHLSREAQTASALNHPNICTVYQIGRVDDGFYLVMELVEGQPLNEMARSTKLTTEAVTRYGVQIADALAHAHDRQIVHRDLKGANVVITHGGRVKVLDFGLARRLDKATVDVITRSLASVERDRSIVGTLPYLAPEVLTGETAGYQSDIWALGVLLYEAVTGQLPFGGSTSYGLSAAILHELPKPLPPSVPPGLSAVLMRCLAKDLKDRFQRAGEIRSALETIQSAAIVSEPRRDEPIGPRTIVLRGIKHLDVKNGDVLLLVGTTKGLFVVRSKSDRKHWDVAGPYFHGHAVYSLAYDSRNGRHRLWASTGSPLWGTFLRLQRRFRQDLDQPVGGQHQVSAGVGSVAEEYLEDNAGACGGTGQTILRRGAGRAVRVTRCGRIVVAGAAGLFDHPHRPRWMPGQGGLCLHTILLHPTEPGRIHVGISAAGVYRTDDGGRTWQARNRGIRVTFMPERYPEFGQCVHEIVRHPDRPDRLFLQNHWGLYHGRMTARIPGTTSRTVCRRDPEDIVDPQTRRRGIDNFASFMRLLAPVGRLAPDAAARNGEQVFGAIGCAACHVPELVTPVTATRSSIGGRCRSSPISCCTTSGPGMGSSKAPPRPPRSGRPRCGASASAGRCCTMVRPRRSRRRSCATARSRIGATGLRPAQRRRSRRTAGVPAVSLSVSDSVSPAAGRICRSAPDDRRTRGGRASVRLRPAAGDTLLETPLLFLDDRFQPLEILSERAADRPGDQRRRQRQARRVTGATDSYTRSVGAALNVVTNRPENGPSAIFIVRT